MPAKQRRSKSQSSRRAAQRRRASSRRRPYILIAVVIVVAIALVAIIALASRPGAGPDTGDPISMDKSKGSETAPVVVIEYADFQCPFCQEFATGPEAQLGQEYIDTGQVRFVFRHFAFIGSESTWAAEASECANEQARFWEYHDKLFAEQGAENSGAFSKDNLKRFAAELGLATAQFDQCLDSGKYRSKVQQEIRAAQDRRLDRTPSILVDGTLVTNGQDYEVLKSAIDAALARD